MRFVFSAITCLVLFSIPPAHAQTDVWNHARKIRSDAGAKTTGLTERVKNLKEQIRRWGLDSNYRHALSLGVTLNTDGWSGQILYQKPRGDLYQRKKGKYAGQSDIYRLSFSEVKHEKQIKQQKENTAFPELGAAAPFVFGKINNLYLLQLGYGREQLLLPGIMQGNLSLSLRYSAGLSLAMLKPYYLRIMHATYTPDIIVTLEDEKYQEDNRDVFLDKNKIFGGAGWSRGLDETAYVPGLFIEGSFALEPAKSQSFIQVITMGGQFSAYTRKLPVMAETEAYPYCASLFVGISLGKKWK